MASKKTAPGKARASSSDGKARSVTMGGPPPNPPAQPAPRRGAKPPKKPEKPAVAQTTWSIREVLDPGTPVGAVACVLGRIMIAGPGLFRVLPGTWDVQHRPLPESVGFPLSIAMEPRPPFRVAVGPETGDALIFTDTPDATSITGHGFAEQRGSKQARELCWVVNDGQSSLFARTEDGMLYRMQAEGWDQLEVPPVHAIAQDEAGGFAALTVVDGTPRAYVSYDGGGTWFLRPFGVEVEAEPDAPAALALSGERLAAIVGDSGPIVSPALGAPTTRHRKAGDGFERAYALAFAGPARDAWLYVALQRKGKEPAGISLLTAGGETLKVMDFLAEDEEPFDLGPIAHDSTRDALMVASRGGLLAIGPDAPKPAAKKKRAVLQ